MKDHKLTLILREHMPYTYDSSGLYIYGAALGTFAVLIFSVAGKRWYFWSLLIITVLLFSLALLIFFLEACSKLFPVFRYLLKPLIFVPKLLRGIYVRIGAFFLRPVLVYVNDNLKAHGSEYILANRPDQDDRYAPGILNFDDLKSVKIKFSSSSTYWRFGLKFASGNMFTNARLAQNYPLFHLAKDGSNNIVYRVYYDENSSQRPNVNLIENYDGSPIIIEVDKKNGLRIVLKNDQGETLLSENFPAALHKFAQVFAWGDGWKYKVTVNIEKRSIDQ